MPPTRRIEEELSARCQDRRPTPGSSSGLVPAWGRTYLLPMGAHRETSLGLVATLSADARPLGIATCPAHDI